MFSQKIHEVRTTRTLKLMVDLTDIDGDHEICFSIGRNISGEWFSYDKNSSSFL